MTGAAILFAIAAVGGVIMAPMRFGGRELPPMALAVVHGLFAAAGLVTRGHLVFHHGVGTDGVAAGRIGRDGVVKETFGKEGQASGVSTEQYVRGGGSTSSA